VVLGTAAALASFFLVAVAGVVALLAYWAASGAPDLDLRVAFGHAQPRMPILLAADQTDPAAQLTVRRDPESMAHVTIVNRSKYSAKNPGVKIELSGTDSGFPDPRTWNQIETATNGACIAIQWDGGVDYIIHGSWERLLPAFGMGGALVTANMTPELTITVVADGIAPLVRKYRIEVLGTQEYEQRTNMGAA
jgi:hypothetical protein